MSELVLETNPIESEKATSTEVTSSSTTIEPVKQGSIVEGLKKEYSVVGDGLYASVSAEEAPQWLTGILDNVISSRLDANLTNLQQANLNIVNSLSELEIAKNQYQELININATIDSVVTSRLTTLNATVDQNTASIMELDINKVTETEAISIAGDVVQASLDSGAINARVGSVETALTNTNVALASTTTALEAQFDDIAAVTSTLENSVIATDQQAQTRYRYNSVIEIDGKSYTSGFGLVTDITFGGDGTAISPYESEFRVDADRFVLDGTLIVGDPADNVRYSYIDNVTGEIGSYEYIAGAYRPYKSLKRKEYGVANSGTTVTIPGYFLTRPYVLVSPKVAPVYDVEYKNQSQTYTCSADNVREVSEGVWAFDARLDLTLSANVADEVYNDNTNTTSNTFTTPVYTSPPNTTSILVNTEVGSVRGTGTNNQYYYRRVRYRVGIAESPTGTYTWSPFTTVTIGASLGPTLSSISINAPSSKVWYTKLEFIAENAGGVFTLGGSGYDYDTLTAYSSSVIQLEQHGPGERSGNIEFPDFSLIDGWSIYEVTYSADAAFYVLAVSGSQDYGISSVGCTNIGFSYRVDPPYNNQATGGDYNMNNWKKYTKTVSTSIFDRRVRAYAKVSTVGYQGSAVTSVRNCSVTVKIRKLKGNSTAPSNRFDIRDARHTLSTSQILAEGSLNWVAIE